MKTLIISLFLGLTTISYSQTITNQNVSNEIPAKEDYDLKKFDSESASEISKMSEEEKKLFAKIFVFKKGGFSLPEKPLRTYFNKD